jgi:hypothetical protein
MTGARWRPGLGEPVFSADAVQVIAQVMMRSGVASKSLPSGPRVPLFCLSAFRKREFVTPFVSHRAVLATEGKIETTHS